MLILVIKVMMCYVSKLYCDIKFLCSEILYIYYSYVYILILFDVMLDYCLSL
jgi:hypothetical protein